MRGRRLRLAGVESSPVEIVRRGKPVAISQGEPRVERYRRLPSGVWEYSDVTDGPVTLSTGAVVDVGKLFEGLPD
jgi:hypothetical protein